LYVLRGILAKKWLETSKTVPPTLFTDLLSLVSDKTVLSAILNLLEQKKAHKETEITSAVPVLNDYIETELARLETVQIDLERRTVNIALLNQLFHDVLNETSNS